MALDLIYERVGNPASGVLTDAEMVLREDPRWHVFYRASKHIDFVLREWLDYGCQEWALTPVMTRVRGLFSGLSCIQNLSTCTSRFGE